MFLGHIDMSHRLTTTLIATLWSIADGNVTHRELARDLGLRSTNSIHGALLALRDLGLVSWHPGKCRTLQLTQTGWLVLRPPAGFRFLPIVGTPQRVV